MIRLRRGSGEASPLWIWEMPQDGAKYYIGADAARGREDGDFSAAVGWNGHTGEQAFTYANRIGVERFAWVLNSLGLLYNRAMMYPEQTGGDGAHVMTLLRDTYRYPTWAPWKGKDDKIGAKPSRTIGWETTYRSRQRLLVMFRVNIANKFLKVRDPRLVAQMASAIRDDINLRWEVVRGHDDIFMAAMIGAMAVEQWPPAKQQVRKDLLPTGMSGTQDAFKFGIEPDQRLRELYEVTIRGGQPQVDPLEGI